MRARGSWWDAGSCAYFIAASCGPAVTADVEYPRRYDTDRFAFEPLSDAKSNRSPNMT